MLYDFNNSRHTETTEFHQRVADQNIQGIDRQEELQHAKNGFIGMLAGILVGGLVGWLFFGPAENTSKEKEMPVIRRPLTPAKVLPNDPGGMEIHNQNREIYHIIDNEAKAVEEVNIVAAPDMKSLAIENTIPAPENIENLVESIEEDGSLDNLDANIEEASEKNVKVVDSELSTINTTSKEKVVIPAKIENIEVKLQNNVNSQTQKDTADNVIKNKEVNTPKKTLEVATKATKGTWYAQIIASSSRKTVENLWQQLAAKHAFLLKYTHEVEEIKVNNNILYRLKVGAFKTRKEAENLAAQLKQNQISSIIKQN